MKDDFAEELVVVDWFAAVEAAASAAAAASDAGKKETNVQKIGGSKEGGEVVSGEGG